MAVKIEKDKKGACYIISHKRCGYHEQIFLTPDELAELYQILSKAYEIGLELVKDAECKQ